MIKAVAHRSCLHLAFVLALVLSWDSRCLAQEATVYWDKRRAAVESVIFSEAVATVRGQMIGFDAQRTVLQVNPAEPPLTIPSDQVVGVEVTWPDGLLQQANAAFRQDDFTNAIIGYQKAINDTNTKPWQQKLALLQIASAATQVEKIGIATKVFSLLHDGSLPQFGYAYMPLRWTSDPVLPNVQADLSDFAAESNPIYQLIVGSWRLTGSEQSRYVAQLEAIAKSNQTPLSSLATAQLWRVIPPQQFATSRLKDAITYRDQLPLALQVGPTLAIADLIERSGDFDHAYLLWVEAMLAAHQQKSPLLPIATRHLEDMAMRTNRMDQWNQLKEVLNR